MFCRFDLIIHLSWQAFSHSQKKMGLPADSPPAYTLRRTYPEVENPQFIVDLPIENDDFSLPGQFTRV